jgi:hypothetical protein
MANAAVLHANLADDGTLSVSDEEALMRVAMLQDPHVLRRWRSRTLTPYFVLDLGATASIDTIMLRGMTVTDDCTLRVRISSADATGAAGDVYDSATDYPTGIEDGDDVFDVDYGALLILLPAVLSTGRYVRIDFNEAGSGATYVEAGRLGVGVRTAFDINFAPGATVGWIDRSIRAKTRGGQTLVWHDDKHRAVSLNMEWVTSSQRYGLVETMDRVNGQSTDILLVLDTESDNLARDSIWGLVSDLTPVAYTNIYGSDGAIFQKSYQIEERQ